MKRFSAIIIILILCLFIRSSAQNPDHKQISQANLIEISKAEDELRYDNTLKAFMKTSNLKLRKRAALAAGRIGDDSAIPELTRLLERDVPEVSQMAAFAIGEIESVKGAGAILRVLLNRKTVGSVRARAIEAAGKIAAANSKKGESKKLGKAILDNLEFEAARRSKPAGDVVLLGITAALRAKSDGAEKTLFKFTDYSDWRIRADAFNALARLKAKNANSRAQHRMIRDVNPIVRANAARVLGAAKDESSFALLARTAENDTDLRVRVNAIRALGGLRETVAAERLLEIAEKLFVDYKNSKAKNPIVKNEILTIISAVGNILKGTEDSGAVKFLREFRVADKFRSPETEIAFARIAPKTYLVTEPFDGKSEKIQNISVRLGWRFASNLSRGLAEYANLSDKQATMRRNAFTLLSVAIGNGEDVSKDALRSLPGRLRAFASFKFDSVSLPPSAPPPPWPPPPGFISKIVRDFVVYRSRSSVEKPRRLFAESRKPGHFDVFVRATAASLLGGREVTKENIEALKTGFKQALLHDVHYDDAQLAILSALVKLDKNAAKESLNLALNHYAILVRRRAANLIRQNELEAEFPNLKQRVGTVRSYDPKTKSRLGQILNTDTDYKRAVSRKNGKSRAILATEKGEITIEFFPEQAPLTVDNYIKLAKSGYFNGIEIHRVVSNFVVQDGDPRGDGNGGPGWQIRCEINQIPYKRGMVGMALSGKDTGGSQWFVTHAPQPHLDGGYTIFGRVNERDMKIVDNLVRGDKILSVKIVEE